MVSAPAKRRGRPASVKAPVMATAPAKRRGRPASVKAPVMVTAPAKRRGGKKVTAPAKTMKPSMKAPAKAVSKGRGRRASAKA